MKVSRQLRARFPNVDLEIVDAALARYEERFAARIEIPKPAPKRLLGWQASLFLHSILAKSKALHLGAVASWNMGNASSAFLNVRAHYEATAGLGHFVHHLKRFYDGKIDLKELDGILYQKSFGVRDARWRQGGLNPPDAINVVTQIKALDAVWAVLFPNSGELVFKIMYDGLCEFCHLNFGGLDLHREVDDNGLSFDGRLLIREDAYSSTVNAIDISLLSVFALFDAAVKLLEENEEMPGIQKLK